MSNKKEALIVALEQEADMFKAKGLDIKEHEIVIEYLKKGSSIYDAEDFPLLDAAMNDLETLYWDYGC